MRDPEREPVAPDRREPESALTGRPLRVLTFSSLYPSASRPRHGVFVEERLRQIVATGRIEARVVSPVPWFPVAGRAFGRWSEYASVPAFETRHRIRVDYPRYLSIPWIGMSAAPWLLARAMRPVLERIVRSGFAFDVIDAHYFYPDGVAAAWLGRRLGRPVVVTARGSDVNLIATYRLPRRFIRRAARASARVVAVSEALRERLIALGIAPDRVVTLPNGVDLARFRPVSGEEVRRRYGVAGPLLLSVGKLDEAKGHHLVIDALARIPEAHLLVVGEGPSAAALERRIAAAGLGARARLAGPVAPADMPAWYGAADALVLASAREGMPNVVLEALACGCPVVATRAGGIPEVVDDPSAGALVAERTPEALAAAIATVLRDRRDREAVRRHAMRFGWEPTVRGHLRVLEGAAGVAARVLGKPS